MAKGGGNNRQREVEKEDKNGPTKNQLRGLSWNTTAAQPAFLRNAMSALSGPSKPVEIKPNSGRPDIPERPGGGNEEESESEEDEWDFGRGEEAPSVVILKEGKHLDRNEVDKIRAQAKADSSLDPLASSSAPTKIAKLGSTLNFSTSTSTSTNNKRKLAEGEIETTESWEDVIKRSKVEGELKKVAQELKEVNEKKEKERGEKVKKKEKKLEKKKVSMLSFDQE